MSTPVTNGAHAGHSHGHEGAESKVLWIAFIATFFILLLELVGGFLSGSLALLADAAHVVTDCLAAGIALWAAGVAKRLIDDRMTFGYGRVKVLAALVNACALFAVVGVLLVESIKRLGSPEPVKPGIMLAVPAIALVANLFISLYLARSSSGKSLNVRAVTAHIVGDAVVSAGVVVAAIFILTTGWYIVDPIASVLASAVVAFSAYNLVRDSLSVLMESVPTEISLQSVRELLWTQPEIDDVHDLHVWTVTDSKIAGSLHVRIPQAELDKSPQIVTKIKLLLHDRFDIDHCTVEIECVDCEESCT